MIKAIKLRTEYLLNPIGIDILKPRFFWNVQEAKKQTAYEIRAEYHNGQAAWGTGKVNGSNMFAYYEGEELKSRDRLFWKVRLWNEEGNSGDWSESSFFEIGLINKTDWKAKWITANTNIDRNNRYPCDYFRKQFRVDKEVESARLYITACGLYEASLNGRKIGEDLFASGYTDYKRRIQYQVYDITEQIAEGINDFDVVLGDGWYRG
ncbi:MAG: Bacterial alpha-L-rhamnosidase, partial [Clostridiales bacterium]|nr:Bacterial alpha-L-rhamnosidase [Clostridiales bacterium]